MKMTFKPYSVLSLGDLLVYPKDGWGIKTGIITKIHQTAIFIRHADGKNSVWHIETITSHIGAGEALVVSNLSNDKA